MDWSALRVRPKPLPIPKLVAKQIGPGAVKRIEKEGGLGVHQDTQGRTRKIVNVAKDGRVNVTHMGTKRRDKNLTTDQKEHRDFLEDLMERESTGKHPNLTPTEAKHAKRRLKHWTDGGRPMQGVDV